MQVLKLNKCTISLSTFGASRRIVLTITKQKNVLVRGEYTYKSDLGVPKPLTKPGKMLFNMNPPVIRMSNSIKQAKKVDVNNLLKKHYGDQWRNIEDLLFYKNIIDEADNSEGVKMMSHPVSQLRRLIILIFKFTQHGSSVREDLF